MAAKRLTATGVQNRLLSLLPVEPEAVDTEQLARWCGTRPSSSTLNFALRLLMARGLIKRWQDGRSYVYSRPAVQ